MEEDDPCIKHFFCNCFQLVETERSWEFGLIVSAIVILTISWFFALMMVPKANSGGGGGGGGTVAVWMAWLVGFTLVMLIALLMVRRSVEHKIKYKRFRDSTREPWSKLLG